MTDDALANERTLTAPSNGQAQAASAGQSQSATDSQPSTGQVDENIRKLQSTYDKKLAEQARAAEAARREAQQAQQFAQQLQQRLQQLEDSAAPDDYSRMELRVKRAEEQAAVYANAYQQSLQAQQEEQQRQAAVRELAEEFELNAKELDEALTEAGISNYAKAAVFAAKFQRDKEKAKAQQRDDKLNRNAPDVGASAPMTSQSEWDAKWDAAFKAKNSQEMTRLLRIQPQGKK